MTISEKEILKELRKKVWKQRMRIWEQKLKSLISKLLGK